MRDPARLWARTQRRGNCLEFIGARNTKGYGRFYMDNRPIAAHRAAWELTHGPIPAGLYVLHRCDNPPCINPDHLFLGTAKDNNQDKAMKGRGRGGESYRKRMEKGLVPKPTLPMTVRQKDCEPVGIIEVCERLGVSRAAMEIWRRRDRAQAIPFPEPDWIVGGRPAWDWSTVLAWVELTGRSHYLEVS